MTQDETPELSADERHAKRRRGSVDVGAASLIRRAVREADLAGVGVGATQASVERAAVLRLAVAVRAIRVDGARACRAAPSVGRASRRRAGCRAGSVAVPGIDVRRRRRALGCFRGRGRRRGACRCARTVRTGRRRRSVSLRFVARLRVEATHDTARQREGKEQPPADHRRSMSQRGRVGGQPSGSKLTQASSMLSVSAVSTAVGTEAGPEQMSAA